MAHHILKQANCPSDHLLVTLFEDEPQVVATMSLPTGQIISDDNAPAHMNVVGVLVYCCLHSFVALF